MTYLIELPDLAIQVENAAVTPKHTALLSVLRGREPLRDTTFATLRDGFWLARRMVLTSAGTVVAQDHRAWLTEELSKDGGRPAVTAQRLRALDYRLSVCTLDKLYFIADRGGDQDNFIQIKVEQLRERVERRMFDTGGGWRTLRDIDDLVEEAEQGVPLADADQVRLGCDRYELRRVIDVRAFMAEGEALKLADHTLRRKRTLMVADVHPGSGPVHAPRPMTIDELDPQAKHWIWPARRLFNDWTASSAGRAGHRLCKHWVLQIQDYTSPKGERNVGVVPLWTHTRKMAKVGRVPNVHTLLGKLQSIDFRCGPTFGWFFYMLHGNLIDDSVGRRILQAAEDGLIVLPEHDYQVLRRWKSMPYGF